MSNGADGSLVIDTELDNDGFEKGSDKLLTSVDNLAKQVNTLGLEMKNAFAGVTSILKTLAAASNSAATGTSASTDQATQAAQAAQQNAQAQAQAAQQSAQAQTQAAQQTARAQVATTSATKTATTATRNYDKELAKLEKQITTAKNNLSGYYQELASISQSTDEMMANADGPNAAEQINNILEIEKLQIEAVNQKYAAKLDILKQLETQYANIAAARDAANAPVPVTPGENAANGAATAGITDTGAAAEAAAPKVGFFSRCLAALQPAMARVGSAALSVGKGIAKIAFKAVATGAKKAAAGLKNFVSNAKKTVTQNNKLVKSLTSLKTMLVSRIKRMFISAVFRDVGEALKQLALFDSKFNDQMSNMKNSLTQLTGNISVTVKNIITVLEPIITKVIDLMNKAVTAVNKFFAALAGKSTYTAAKKGNEKFAESAEDAAAAQKKLNRELYSFDELNRQSKDDSGTETEESKFQFEELPLDLPASVTDWINQLKEAWNSGQWYELGKTAAQGLNAAIKTVDDWINNVLRPKGTMWAGRFAEILNGFTDGVDWPQLGKTIADGVNAIADIYNTFMYSYDWNNLGRKVGEGLNSIIHNTEWDQIGAAFAAKWQALVGFMHGLVHETDWAGMGQGIGTAIDSWFKSIDWVMLADSVVTGFNGLVTMLRNTITSIDWGNIGTTLANALTTMITGIDWGNIGGLLSDAVKNLCRLAFDFISNVDWFAIGDSLMQGIIDMIVNIDWGTILATLGALAVNLVAGALDLVLGALSGLTEKLAEGFRALGMDGVAGFFQGISDFLADVGTWIKEHIVDPVVDWVKKLFGIHSPSTVMAEIGTDVSAGLLQGISEKWADIKTFFSDAISNLTDSLSKGWDRIKTNAKDNWENLKTNVTTAFENTKTKIQDTATQIGSNLRSKWGDVKSEAQTAWSNVKTTISNAFNNARTSVSNTASNMRSNLSGTFSGIVSNAQTTWGNLQTVTNNKFSSLQQNVMKAWQNLRNNLNNVQWNNIGHNLVAGLNNGVAGAWGGFMSNVTNMVNNLIRRIKNLFGIHSPSKVFAEIGEFLDAGLSVGMENGERGLLTTAKNIATAVTDGMTPDTPNVQMNVDSVVGSMQAIISSLGSLAVTFQTIANALTSIGGFTLPNIAAGKVVPYQTKVAANTAPAGAEGGVEAYLLGILAELQALSRSMRNGDGGQAQDIRVFVGERELFQVVVDANNRVVRTTGKSPLKVG